MHINLKMEPRVHKKTGNIYFASDTDIIECTNGREDKIYTLYFREGKLFCREKEQFEEKFSDGNDLKDYGYTPPYKLKDLKQAIDKLVEEDKGDAKVTCVGALEPQANIPDIAGSGSKTVQACFYDHDKLYIVY